MEDWDEKESKTTESLAAWIEEMGNGDGNGDGGTRRGASDMRGQDGLTGGSPGWIDGLMEGCRGEREGGSFAREAAAGVGAMDPGSRMQEVEKYSKVLVDEERAERKVGWAGVDMLIGGRTVYCTCCLVVVEVEGVVVMMMMKKRKRKMMMTIIGQGRGRGGTGGIEAQRHTAVR